ncbi:MAG: YhbY family RNA-binding protein [Acidobacteria bacterium]|nr:YhbY family RNA-binding protein [Acidobacteriota bacterium]
MSSLTPKQRQFLKAKAHALKPLIQVGKAGVTPALTEELDRVMEIHELVKVKLNDNTFEDEEGVIAAFTSKVEGLIHVWTIGHTLLLFRPSRSRPTRFPLP